MLAASVLASLLLAAQSGQALQAHLDQQESPGFAELSRAFESANPGYRMRWLPRSTRIDGESATSIAFVQGGQGKVSMKFDAPARADDAPRDRSISHGETFEVECGVGDAILLRPKESARFEPPCDLLVFESPLARPPDLPWIVRPDWDPKITDKPGGCATEFGAYRRILLTWDEKVGPYVYHALNAHRVRITDSFTHYHPKVNGFDELYLVQHANVGAKLWVGEKLDALLDPSAIDADAARGLLRSIEVHAGDLIYLPRGVAHRGVGGILAQIITVPGFVPGAEIPLDEKIEAINKRLTLTGDAALPFHRARPKVEVRLGDETVEISIGGKPFTTYRFTGGHPCFYPVRTPAGTEATRAFPFETRDGEATDHPHHRSLWFAHGDLGGQDFWQGAGTVKQGQLVSSEAGEGRGWFAVEDEWLGGDGALVARDRRRYEAFEFEGAWGLDVDLVVRATEHELKFGDTKEGTMAVRLAPGLAVTEGGALLDSEGRRDDAVWGKRARWMLASGTTRGAAAAVAMFDHPENPRYPTTWHARNYGLVAANPFGLSDFEGAAKGTGDLVVPANGELRLRWRIMVFDRVPSAETLERIAADHARGR
jgi:hypothetical protein